MDDIDIRVLRRCRDLIDKGGADGMFPRGGQHRQFQRLEREGLLRYVGQGADIDSESVREDYHIYEITVSGRNRLAEIEAEAAKATR